MVDSKRLQFTAGVEISYIDKEIQQWICEYIHENGNVKQNQIVILRQELLNGAIIQSQLIGILNENAIGRIPKKKVTLSEKKLEEMEELLKQYQQAQESSKGAALTPDGNLTLVDDVGSDTGAGKQFITLVTKAGNTFYLIIDRDDKGEQTVHFLNLVDEADLLALMDEDEAAKYEKPAEPPVVETPPTTEPENPEPAEQEPEEPEKKAPNMMPAIFLLIALAGVGGFVGYKKLMENMKKKEQEKPDPEADYVDDEEDYGYDENAEYENEDDADYSGEDDNEPV